MSAEPQDPNVTATVERALDPYREILSPEMLEVFREELTEALTEHPVAKTLTNRLRDRPAPNRNGDVETEAGAEEAAKGGSKKATKSGGKR